MNSDWLLSFCSEAEQIILTRGRVSAAKLCAALLTEIHTYPQSLRIDDEASRIVTGPNGDTHSIYWVLVNNGHRLSGAQTALIDVIVPALEQAQIKGAGRFEEVDVNGN